MNTSERHQQLLEWLESRGQLSVEEIQEKFGVSTATAYREIRAVVETGQALKTNGGLKWKPSPKQPPGSDQCSYCGGTINERTAFLFQLTDGSLRKTCCGHCGMMVLKRLDAPIILTNDFLYGRLVNARQAAFILDSTVSLCCEPSVICFANEADARNFQRGFGGSLYTLEQSAARMQELMG